MKELRIVMPTRWVDLTEKQLVYVSRLWMMGYPEAEFLVKAFLKLAGLSVVSGFLGDHAGSIVRYRHSSVKGAFGIDTDVMAEIVEKCRFLMKPDEVMPIKYIAGRRARHYRLYDASFEEYLMAENYYFAYVETKKEEYLNCLIACLYRRPWQRWDAGKIQERANVFRRIDPAVKNAVFMWYLGFRMYVPKRCKALFSGKGGSSKGFNAREYINGMIHTLSNGDITIKDRLLSAKCWDALDELEQRAIECEKIANK